MMHLTAAAIRLPSLQPQESKGVGSLIGKYTVSQFLAQNFHIVIAQQAYDKHVLERQL